MVRLERFWTESSSTPVSSLETPPQPSVTRGKEAASLRLRFFPRLMWLYSRRYLLVGRATRNCMSRGWDGRVPVCEGKLNRGGGEWGVISLLYPGTRRRLSSSYWLRRAPKSGQRRAKRLQGAVVHLPERGPLQLPSGDPDGLKRGLVHAGRDVEHSSHMRRCVREARDCWLVF